jgi:ribosomal-protein-alanine N-acetyltransferase
MESLQVSKYNMMYVFKTPRLGFRKWKVEDRASFARLNGDEETMKYFPEPMTRKASDDLVDRIELHFEKHGYGYYAVDELSTGKFIGFIGFGRPRFDADFTPCIEIGWRIHKDFWGNGYGTEGALACLDYAFDHLGLEEIYAMTATYNTPSERVMQKIGMMRIGAFDHPLIERGHPLERHVLYRIRRTAAPN